MTALLMNVLPYVFVLGLGFVLGFCVRSRTVDRLQAKIIKLVAERDGIEIRTSSRTEPVREPVRPVQPRTRPNRTGMPMYGPEHTAARTEPLPTGVRYVAAAEGNEDRPMSDQEYADMMRAQFSD